MIVLYLLNLAGHESTLRETARTYCFFGIHTGYNTAGSVRALVANHVTEFEILTYEPIRRLGNRKTASWKLGKWTEGSCSGYEMRTGVPVSYRVATHKGVTA